MKPWRTDFARRAAAAAFALLILTAVAGWPRSGAAEPPSPLAAGFSNARFDPVGDYIRNEVAAGRIPGAVVLIQQHGRPVYFESFGVRDVESKRPMTTDSIFRLYSM